MPRTFEEILREANAKGLTLANLFQLRTLGGTISQPAQLTGEWKANFQHLNGWYDYGRGMSAVECLEDALARCKGLKGPENRPIPKAVKVVAENTEVEDLI